MSVKLLVADDEEVIRRGVAKYIRLHTDRFDKIYEAENGQEAIDLLLKYQPDILLLDVQMPLKNGLDVMKEAERAGLHPIVVILSGYDEFKYAQQALRFGAKEYLLKPARAADILKCLNRLVDDSLGLEEPCVQEEENGTNQLVKRAKEVHCRALHGKYHAQRHRGDPGNNRRLSLHAVPEKPPVRIYRLPQSGAHRKGMLLSGAELL